MGALSKFSSARKVPDMPELEWSIENFPASVDVERIAEGVLSFGRAIAQSDASPIACFVRLQGTVVAGACGRTEFNRLFVNYVWVEERRRRHGLASELLQRLEAAAKIRGCFDALIETLSNEIATLYQRQGYEPLAIIPNYVGKFTRHVLRKPL